MRVLKRLYTIIVNEPKEDAIARKAMAGKLFSHNSVRATFIQAGYSEEAAEQLAGRYVWRISD